MNLRAFLRSRKAQPQPPQTDSANPFVKGNAGKKIWDDRYRHMENTIGVWQKAFMVSSVITLISLLIIVRLATEPRTTPPFAVETNNGMPVAIKPVNSISAEDQKIVNYAMDQFIINTRSVLSDDKAEESLLLNAFAFSADSALSDLHTYFHDYNPLELGQHYTVSVNIINSMPLGDSHTWQVVWDETKQSVNGDKSPETTRWMADLTYRFGKINKDFMTNNPFGLYITRYSLSQSHVTVKGA